MELTKLERKQLNNFSYKFKFDGKRTSKKAMVEKFGKSKLERWMLECAEDFVADPMESFEFVNGLEIIVNWK